MKNFASLVALRFLIGALEAGFAPGCVYLISMYYQRYELQWRMSIFFSASILAGAFAGLFAYALAHMNGLGGYSGTCILQVGVLGTDIHQAGAGSSSSRVWSQSSPLLRSNSSLSTGLKMPASSQLKKRRSSKNG